MLTDMTWVIATALLVSMLMAMALGANDVGNFFGTSVGTSVLSMKSAFFLATICEIAGAVLLGERVSDTIWKNIIDYTVFGDQEVCLMLGNLSALIGCSTWMIIATRFSLPVSATHSIVGATVGYAMVVHGSKGVNWKVFGHILISWLISPILSGVLSLLLFYIVRKFLSQTKKPCNIVLKWLPITCAITVMVNVFSIMMFGPRINLSLIYILLLTCLLGLLVNLFVWFLIVPHLKLTIQLYDCERCNDAKQKLLNAHTTEHMAFYKSLTDLENDDLKPTNMDFIFSTQKTKVSEGQVANIFYERNAKPQLNHVAIQVFLPPYDENVMLNLRTDPNLTYSTQHPTLIYNSSHQSMFPPKIKSRIDSKQDCKILQNKMTKMKSLQNFHLPLKHIFHRTVSIQSKVHALSKEIEDVNSISSSLSDSTFIDDFKKVDKTCLNEQKKRTMGYKCRVFKDPPSVIRVFSVLQIMSSLFGSFTHGFNDVSNAIAPLVAVWMLWVTEINLIGAKTPLWILLYGGTCISIGIWLCGDRTIKTIGSDITYITPSSGFVIELCSAIAVLIASNMGLPVSSTHCKVGSVVCVGRMNGKDAVNWKLVRNISIAWLATFPVTAVISASVMAILRKAISITHPVFNNT